MIFVTGMQLIKTYIELEIDNKCKKDLKLIRSIVKWFEKNEFFTLQDLGSGKKKIDPQHDKKKKKRYSIHCL